MKLSESHSLVKFTFNMFGDRVTRSDLSGETVSAHGIQNAKAVKTTIDAMGSEEFIELKNLRQSSRNEFNALSFPWDTYRIAPNLNVDPLEKIASTAQIKAEQIRERIVEKLPAWIDLQRQVMGTAFREEDYMTADVIREKVRVSYDIRTVPDPEYDPRAGVSDLSRERFSAKIRKEESRKVAEAVIAMQNDLAKLVGKMKESFEGYNFVALEFSNASTVRTGDCTLATERSSQTLARHFQQAKAR